MDPFFKKIKDEVEDRAEARQLAWDEFLRRSGIHGMRLDTIKDGFKFAFDAALSFGQFRTIDPDEPLDDNHD